MDSRKSVHVIFVWSLIIGTCLASADHDWITQITGFIDPIPAQVSSRCTNHTLRFIEAGKNVSNFWAISMIDATAKFPSGVLSGNIRSMGNFDQCLRVEHPNKDYVGKYCSIRLKYTPYGANKVILQEYIDLVMAGRRLLEEGDDWENGTHILPTYSFSEWALCMPSSCSAEDVRTIAQTAIHRATLDTELTVSVFLDESLCYAADETRPFRVIDYVVASIFMALFLVVIIGSIGTCGVNKRKEDCSFPKPLEAFSVTDNWKQLTDTRMPSKETISCLDGMRTLSTVWVVMTHQTILISQLAYMNKLETKQTHDTFTYYAMWNSYFNVDTFLLVSGLLRSYSLIKDLARGKLNIFRSSLQRYLRLTPAYLFVILFYISFFDRIDSGPNWNLYVGRNSDACRSYWWQNLLYINNYIPHNEKCLLQSWYLSTDMQLFLLAPLLVYPLWKWKIFGRVLMVVATIVSIILPLVTTFVYRFPGTYIFSFSNSLLNSYAHRVYMATHNRMSPYFVGLILGYVFHRYKPLEISKWKVVAGWITSLAVMYACVYGAMDMTSFRHTYDLWEATAYGGLHRFAWAIAVAWVIYACHTGYGGFINKFLSCTTFRILGRLSYCVYLTHLAILLYCAAVLQEPRQLHTYITTRNFLGDFVFVFASSVPLYIFVELPFWKITQRVLRAKK